MTFCKPIHETDLTLGVCISAPETGPYRAAAEGLKAVLEGTVPGSVEILPDARLDAGGRHVIALGNMMDSAFLRTLYFGAYDLTDRVWPGPGGWAIRTAPHSLEDVGHVIVVGVSEADDVSQAADALCSTIGAEGTALPYQHRVNLGKWADLYMKPAQERLNQGDEALEREFTSGPGDWTYMWAISEIGMLAVQTGMEALIQMFCRQVCNFARTRWFERHLPDPPQIHGFLRTMLLPFTVLDNHPGLPGDQREETLEAFLGLYRSTEGAGNRGFLSHVGVDRVRQNHQTMSGLDLFYGGRYFHQVHGLAEGRAWMKLADVFFEPQMNSNKPVCDSWGHQWAFSLFNTADYALASGKIDYFSGKPYLEGVDRALIAHSNLEGGPQQYLLMAAAVTGNDEYLQHCGTRDDDTLAEKAVRQNVEPFRTWVTGRDAAEPERMGRVGVAPLSQLFYDSIEDPGGFAPEGVYLRDVPFEQTFDKVYFRSGWTDDDDYLLLCGISGGSHSYQDGNCIVRYTGRGQNWFGGRVGPASVRDHNGVSIAVDGVGPGCESRYAALRYLEEGERLSVAGTSMKSPGLADWYRHIVHGKAGWFLVIDEVWAKADGEYLVEDRWHIYGDVEMVDGTLRAVQSDARLEMRHTGSGSQELVPVTSALAEEGTRWVQRSLKGLRSGEGVRFATLFWSDQKAQPRTYALNPEASGYRVEGEGTVATVSLSAECAVVEVRDDAAVLPTTGTAVEASDAGPFIAAGGEAKPAWRGSCTAAVTAMDVWEGGCFAGDDSGGITAFDRNGGIRWEHAVSGEHPNGPCPPGRRRRGRRGGRGGAPAGRVGQGGVVVSTRVAADELGLLDLVELQGAEPGGRRYRRRRQAGDSGRMRGSPRLRVRRGWRFDVAFRLPVGSSHVPGGGAAAGRARPAGAGWYGGSVHSRLYQGVRIGRGVRADVVAAGCHELVDSLVVEVPSRGGSERGWPRRSAQRRGYESQAVDCLWRGWAGVVGCGRGGCGAVGGGCRREGVCGRFEWVRAVF